MVSTTLTRAAYRAQQMSLLVPALALQRTVRVLTRSRVAFDPATLESTRRRYQELLRRDLANAEAGLYPRSLLFQFPFTDYLRAVPSIVRDLPRSMRRFFARNYRDLPPEAQSARYPSYFRRNFHWQTDGYFSRRSAQLYDPGVEFLFLGTADVMRRQIIPHITRFVRDRGDGPARVLDVACGTGRMLRQLSIAQPALSFYGMDLSPYYVQEARELLSDVTDLSLVVENAESMPFVNDHFDVITSLFLLHELPKDARRKVIAEMYRVLRPGGMVAVMDSAQLSDSPELAGVLDRFAVDFHEPYYKGYLRDDLDAMLAEVGFAVESVETHFVSKLAIGRKSPGEP
jgi:ubiquinone/menaquinone biosynthesis C-methylase UbiE